MLPNREDLIRLRHMLDAARKAVDFVQGLGRSDLDTDEKLSLALVRLLEIIGEAAKNVSQESRQATPAIAWKQIAGTRDRLIHGYSNVDLDVVWAIVARDLPPLMEQLERVLQTSKP